MKRILLVGNHELVIYNFRKEIVKKLLDDKYEVHICSSPGEKIDEMVSWGCIFHEVNVARHGKNPFKDYFLLLKYKKLLKMIKPSCMLTFTIKPNIFASIAAKKKKIKCIVNITGIGTGLQNEGLLKSLLLKMYKYSMKNVDMIFFQNEDDYLFFKNKNIIKNDFFVLPGSGVNLEEFKYKPIIKREEISFLFAARIMKEKGIDIYLDAATIMKKKYPFLIFNICGFCEQAYEEKLMDFSSKGIVNYFGMVNNMKKKYEDCDCLIHPSFYPEGISNVLLEASAIGRTIITTDNVGCRNVVDNGKNGYVIKVNDTIGLIEAIEKYISVDFDGRMEMGIKGREFVTCNFDREIVVNKYLEIIERM